MHNKLFNRYVIVTKPFNRVGALQECITRFIRDKRTFAVVKMVPQNGSLVRYWVIRAPESDDPTTIITLSTQHPIDEIVHLYIDGEEQTITNKS